MTCVAIGGRIAIIGNRGTITINPRGIMGKELQVNGVMLYGASAEEEEESAAGASERSTSAIS